MEKVLLTIKGNGLEGGEDVEFVTEGRLYKNEDGWLIEYEDSLLSGMDGETTCLLLCGDVVTLSRNGDVEPQMVFSKNSVYESNLSTPEGMLHISILALAVDSELKDKSGKLNLEYELSVESRRMIGRLCLSFKSVEECVN